MTELVNKALEIADEFPVFPCNEHKRPVCEGGFKAATQDPDEIIKLFSAPNAALIAIPTGEATGLSVVDIDVRDNKGGTDWRAEHAEVLGVTRIVQTQSGGWHYYYKHKDGIRNRSGIDMCVDIRGEGGYVIVPPSAGYSWINDEDFAEFPERIYADYNADYNHSNIATQMRDTFGAIVDGREKYMADMVMASVSNYRREQGEWPTPEWMDENVWPVYAAKVKSRVGDLEREGRGITAFRQKVRSTLRKAQAGGFPEVEEGKAPSLAQQKSVIERKIKLFSLNQLREMPPPKFQVAPYLVDKSFAAIYGPPASYKSFLALDWALSIAHGADWNGRAVEQGVVVYLALEGQAGLVTRAEAWHRDCGISDEQVSFYAVTSPISMVEESANDVILLREAIEEQLQGEAPSLIIIDTLARAFAGGDENTAKDMSVFVRNVDLLRDHFQCTALVIHHSGKVVEKGMRGSNSLQGAVDSEFEIAREIGTKNVCLKVRKQKETEEAEDLWLSAKEVSWVSGAFDRERSSLVLVPLDGEPDKPVSLTDDQKTAVLVLERLIQEGKEWVESADGSAGIPENVWRQSVAEHLPGKDNPSTWNKFRKRLGGKGVVNVINGLATLGGKAAT